VVESISASLDFTHDTTIMDEKTQETAMGSLRQGLLIPLLLVSFMSGASAADRKPGDSPSALSRPVLTGKERLGPKWTDEQRIDNCKVPVDKRGTKPRPSACPGAPSS
jgi:hypothetical protein